MSANKASRQDDDLLELLAEYRKKYADLDPQACMVFGAAEMRIRGIQWQPIDTAPHEERVLLGWYQQGTWFSETGMASHRWRRNGISNMSLHGYATHWRPLPEGPLNE